MSGFLEPSLNQLISIKTLKYIIDKMIICMDLMSTDCAMKSQKIANNEIVIRDLLFADYLDNDGRMMEVGLDDFRFEAETPENYINGIPQGRADLKVYNLISRMYFPLGQGKIEQKVLLIANVQKRLNKLLIFLSLYI